MKHNISKLILKNSYKRHGSIKKMSHIIKPDFLQLQNEPEKTKENERRLTDEVKRLKTKILTLVEKSLKKRAG